jgi:hypothetical protein
MNGDTHAKAGAMQATEAVISTTRETTRRTCSDQGQSRGPLGRHIVRGNVGESQRIRGGPCR